MDPLCGCLLLSLWLLSLNVQSPVAAETAEDDDHRSVVTIQQTPDGQYARYLPKGGPAGILVLVHGSTRPDQGDSIAAAQAFLGRWTAFAEKHRLIVIAPAFDNANFGSCAGPGGGYRGLFGRHIGADEFVNRLVDAHKPRLKGWDGRMLLYGHSAGGQFVNRYIVRHPDRIGAAVISAAGHYAMPDPDRPWPDGMQPLKRSMRWEGSTGSVRIRVRPDAANWLKAATMPVTVVVGAADTVADRYGNSHVDSARRWVRDMRALAQKNRKDPRVRLVIVQGVGHNSARLTPGCQAALAMALAGQRAAQGSPTTQAATTTATANPRG